MKVPDKAEMTIMPEQKRLIPKQSKRGVMGAASEKFIGAPSRALSVIDHLNRELNRRARGHSIPDDAALFSTGDIVRVKGEALRIKALDPKRLVLESVKEPPGERPKPSVSMWTSELDGSPITATLLAFLDTDGNPVTSEVDRYDEGHLLTVEGTEYVVIGRVLVLARAEEPTSQSSPS